VSSGTHVLTHCLSMQQHAMNIILSVTIVILTPRYFVKRFILRATTAHYFWNNISKHSHGSNLYDSLFRSIFNSIGRIDLVCSRVWRKIHQYIQSLLLFLLWIFIILNFLRFGTGTSICRPPIFLEKFEVWDFWVLWFSFHLIYR